MSWLTETTRRLGRLYRGTRSAISLPQPLDLIVLGTDRAKILSHCLENIVSATRWPLRILVCLESREHPEAQEITATWHERQCGAHRVEVVGNAVRSYPECFNPGLEQVRGDVFALAEGIVTVGDNRGRCWATQLLNSLERFPHLGWLNATLRMPLLPDETVIERKAVRGTQRQIIRDAPQTHLALVRRDLLRTSRGDAPQMKGLLQHALNSRYDTGRHPDVCVLLHPSNLAFEEEFQAAHGKRAKTSFYIITRTHRRPIPFRRCRESIERQTAANRVVHIVTYEDEEDRKYVPRECMGVRVQRRQDVACWYETYVNEALAVVGTEGLLMILDDDDYIVNANFVETMLRNSSRFDALFFRTQLHARRCIPAQLPFAVPPYGDIASCGYVLRADVAQRFQWEAGHAGDYRYINNLFRFELLGKQRIVWCPLALTSTQKGRSEGRGDTRSDRPLTYDDRPIPLYGIFGEGAIVELTTGLPE